MTWIATACGGNSVSDDVIFAPFVDRLPLSDLSRKAGHQDRLPLSDLSRKAGHQDRLTEEVDGFGAGPGGFTRWRIELVL